ncbi:hypothetical protein [Chelativorans salis]|uniref:Tripartite tricarboxylate transporter family receptor n=1 Tax=Chelativorans salis TaxID=2978478 RepID=A0ABT2LI17_9HYPH|nr:hypothetical protein [Chelativorans sp. EGI FJ00035]MCT7374215.1 hypothetical protein [Chelativorans sp. EGI FJ00035]
MAPVNTEINKLLERDDVREAWAEQGAQPLIMNRAEFERYLNDDIAKWAEVVEISGARVQ